MTRALESTYAWYERIVFEIEQAVGRLDRTKDGTKDYAAVYTQPEVGARLALLKVQAGKVTFDRLFNLSIALIILLLK